MTASRTRRLAHSAAHRPRRHRRAEHLSHEALLPVGPRVHGLDDREHAHDRVHRARGRTCSPAQENELATKLLVGAVDLGVPRDHLRVRDGDRRVGALGRDDRVHVHGAAVAVDAPVRQGAFAVLYGLDPGDDPVLRRRGVHRHPHAERELRAPRSALLAIASVSFIGIGMMTSVLPLISPEKGAQLGFVAQGMMLVVSGVYYPVSRHAGLDAGDREDLARDVRAARRPRVDRRRRRARVGRRLAAARSSPSSRSRSVSRSSSSGERYAKKHGKLKRSG